MMRLRSRSWLVICVLSLVGAAIFWRLGEQRIASRRAGEIPASGSVSNVAPAPVSGSKPAAALKLLSAEGRLAGLVPAALREAVAPTLPGGSNAVAREASADATAKPGLRLRNTSRTEEELLRDDHAVHLRNALIDTKSVNAVPIPEHLRAGAEPGSFIVQARGTIGDAFRTRIAAAGGTLVSYLPNNAYLVAASAAQAQGMRASVEIAAVLPFEPYYKLEPSLLRRAIGDEQVPEQMQLTLSLLPGSGETARASLEAIGAKVLGGFRTPFGPAVTISAGKLTLAALARLPEVQGVELVRKRQLSNDRTRERFGISYGTNAPGSFTNTLGLTGTNVWININDSGIDATHPDLAGRVTADQPSTLLDFAGHGTHVAATIAGSGKQSGTVSNAPGSTLPGADFRGMAPAARLFALPIDLDTGPLISDAYLQETAATNYYVANQRTNVLISNNSWGYIGAFEYNISAASYDAAVRDALPEVEGAQPIVYVFATGNEGAGADDGQGGEPSTIRSPGTGKNVITVGAVEAPRNITNEVIYVDAQGVLQTNQVFLAETDTDFQVASFSSRGNVEPGIEGRYGRFKPDVVAPGSFTISARSRDWVDPRGFSDTMVGRLPDQEIVPGARNDYSLFVPPGASEFRIRLLANLRSPSPFPGLPLYLRFGARARPSDLVNTNNLIRVPPDGTMQAGDWTYAVGNLTAGTVAYDILSIITLTNDFGSYFDELKKLNDGVGPHYRYESGSSMAAPAVTGLLALFQDYFQKQQKAASPALLKALLVNGARSLGSLYNFNVSDVINLQGWGAVSLTNTLPADDIASPTGAVAAVQYFDAATTNALITGQSRSWKLKVSPAAQDQIVKFTLVWTDPPGNPSAGLKLVNDLDLEVRNEDTGETFVGNDIPYRSDFNLPRAAGESLTNDVINNVENIVLRPPLGTNYTVFVRGKRVNVNAVRRHPDGIAQDYALVASVENRSLTNSITFEPVTQDLMVNLPFLTIPTNGLALLNQRVGANSPRFGVLPGATNQWSFFVFTNLQQFTPANVGITNGSNVAFITFLPPNLSRPRGRDADIDLYVSTDPAITNLNALAITNAFKSAKPGGTELVYFTNAPLGAVYYVGVKAEDQQAAEFGFVALSSNLPFDEDDADGNRIVRGLPFNLPIPDGSPDVPQAGYVFGIATRSFPVQRVVVTNILSFDSTGDIVGNLSHNDSYVVLNNHALDPNGLGSTSMMIYDDGNAGDIGFGSLLARPTDGPGSLTGFIGTDSAGPWILSLVDNAVTQTSTNVSLMLKLQPRPSQDDFFFTTVQGNSVNTYYVDVPANATNLSVKIAGISQPLWVAVRRGDNPSVTEYDKAADILPTNGELTVGRRDTPPLNAGRWYIGVFNFNPRPVNYGILVELDLDLTSSADRGFSLDRATKIVDDARVVSTLRVGEDLDLVDIKVGLRVDHPRVSDLSFHLVSPQGTRLLLAENRGGTNGTAYGADLGLGSRIFTTFTDSTNLTLTPIKLGLPPFTNSAVPSSASNRVVFSDGFETADSGIYATGSTFPPGWEILAGGMTILRVPPGATNVAEGRQYVLPTGAVIPEMRLRIPVVPGQLYRLKFAVSRRAGGGSQGLRAAISGTSASLVVTEAEVGSGWYRTSFEFRSTTPTAEIHFSVPAGRIGLALDEVIVEEAVPPLDSYYLSEEALKPFVGQRALGDWKLEVTDSRVGPVGGLPGQFEWRLELVFARPVLDAIQLTNNVPYFGTVSGNDIRFFYIEVPRCATIASNTLAGRDATLLLYADRDGLPTANLNSSDDDYGPYFNTGAGGIAEFAVTTATRRLPLVPGQRYYLAVRNFQADRTNNAFGIRVGFDCEDAPLPVVPSLTNGVPIRVTIPPGPGLHFYQFNVSSNAIHANFALRPISGNPDMFIRLGRTGDLPLPSPNQWDYKSDSADPTVTDVVDVGLISPPVPLQPGIWYVAVRNAATVPVEYELVARETYATLIQLTNGISYTNQIATVAPLLGVRPEDYQYYAFLVSSNSTRANFEIPSTDGDVNLYLRRGVPLASPVNFDFAGLQLGAVPEFVAVTNTTLPVGLTAGWWFLTVENADATNVNYTIRASEFAGFVTPLTNAIAVTSFVPAGPDPVYFSFDVDPAALSAKFEVYGLSSDVQLLLKPGLPLPTFANTAYTSTNSGVIAEEITLTPFSFPVGLTPGTWYLGVVNASTNDARFTIRATAETARIVLLTNGVPQNASIAPGAAVDYYQFNVSSGADSADFRLTSARTGDLDLYLRKGAPLPNAANRHYASTNRGVADELIRVQTNSLPIPLTAGVWYLTVTNRAAARIGYEITATEFGVEPPVSSGEILEVLPATNRTCITWISIPGTNYFVVAKTNALQAAWTAISPTIRATADQTTWCVEPPGPWRFFDVLEGETTLVPIAAPVPVLRFDGLNICVGWESLVGTHYFVEARRGFAETNWTTLTGKITATATSTEVCYPVDLGYRFFRVGVGERVPPVAAPLPDAAVQVSSTVDSVCVSWPGKSGIFYLVEAKRNAGEANWTVISEPLEGQGATLSVCLGKATEFTLFRVIEGVSVPAGRPPSLPVSSVHPSVDAAFDLCLTWDSIIGGEYFVEAKERIADPAWTVISPILTAASPSLSYCQPLNSPWRYFQVRRVNRDPSVALRIDAIELVGGRWRMSWSGSPGARYQVFYSELSPTQWLPLGGAVTSISGAFEFIDTTVPTPIFRLYRIEQLP